MTRSHLVTLKLKDMKTSKSLLLIFIGILLFTANLTAQKEVGLRTGINFVTFGPDDFFNNTFNSNAKVGNLTLFMDMPIGKKFSFQPELSYNQKGLNFFDFSFPGSPNIKTDLVLNYLDANLLAKYRFGGEKFGFSIAAGPSIGFLLDGHFKVKAAGERSKEKLNFDDRGWDRFELGAVFGGSLDYKLGPGKLIFDARYNLGLSDIGGSGIKNRGVGLSLGYAIKLGPK